MASTQNQNSDKFKFAITLKIEGDNCRAAMMRFAGIAITIVSVLVKIALIIWH